MRIQRLILAAGAGRRFGADKRRARLSSGETLLEATLSVLCPADPLPLLVLRPGETAPAPFQDQVQGHSLPALGRGARPLPCRRREGLGCRSGALASYRPRRYALPSTGDPEGPGAGLRGRPNSARAPAPDRPQLPRATGSSRRRTQPPPRYGPCPDRGPGPKGLVRVRTGKAAARTGPRRMPRRGSPRGPCQRPRRLGRPARPRHSHGLPRCPETNHDPCPSLRPFAPHRL